MLLGGAVGRLQVLCRLGEILLADVDVVGHVGCDEAGDLCSFPV